jgi:hypothetical protein
MTHTRSVYVLAAALILLGISGFLNSAPSGKLVARLELWRPGEHQKARLQNHENRRLKKLPAKENFETLSNALMDANLASSPLSDVSQKGRQKFDVVLLNEVQRFLEEEGTWAFAGVGAFLAREFVRRLHGLAQKMEDADEPLSQWLVRHEPDLEVREVRALGGRFLEHAIGAGLMVAARPVDPDLMLVARIMWMENWLAMGRRFNDKLHLSRDEWSLLLKWKIEAAQHLPLQKKLAHIKTLLGFDPGYPKHLVRGVLMLQAGAEEEATEEFTASLHRDEQPPLAGDWLVFLRRLR